MIELKNVVVNKVSINTIEFEHENVQALSHHKPSVKTVKKKNEIN